VIVKHVASASEIERYTSASSGLKFSVGDLFTRSRRTASGSRKSCNIMPATFERISMKFNGWAESSPRINRADFGGDPFRDPDPGFPSPDPGRIYTQLLY